MTTEILQKQKFYFGFMEHVHASTPVPCRMMVKQVKVVRTGIVK